MLRKSTSSSRRRACSAAAGTSTITPTWRSPRARARSAKPAASATVLTMGAITQVSAPLARPASAMASSWTSRISGWILLVRSPRTPRAGLDSAGRRRNGRGLSEPASRVRITTRLPGMAWSTAV